MTLAVFLSPYGLAALAVWCFTVLVAVQLTLRLFNAFAFRATLAGTVVLMAATLPAAAVYDALVGSQGSFAARLNWVWVPVVMMAMAGYVAGRTTLRIRRTRAQLVAAAIVGVLAPHLFTLAPM